MNMTSELESSITTVSKLSRKEIIRAIKLHGLQGDISLDKQMVIILEEIGEVAKDINDKNYKNMLAEIIQSVSMLIKLYWMTKLKIRKGLKKKG